MSDEPQKMKALLLSYVSLMAERNSFAPGDNFEYRLWDELVGRQRPASEVGTTDLHGLIPDAKYVSAEEGYEIIYLATNTDSWVTYNDETRMFELIDMDAWEELLSKRGH